MPGASDLKSRLALNETRQAAIDSVVQSYQQTRNLGDTAAALNVSRRTLDRLISGCTDLNNAIEIVRNVNRAIGW